MKMRFQFVNGEIREQWCGPLKYKYQKVAELIADLRRMDTPGFRESEAQYRAGQEWDK